MVERCFELSIVKVSVIFMSLDLLLKNQWKNSKMNSLSQREICDGTECLSEILYKNRLPVLTYFKLEFHSNLGDLY